MAVVRRARILVGIILVTITFFTSKYYGALPEPPDWASKLPSFPDTIHPSKAEDPPYPDEIFNATAPIEHADYQPVETKLVPDAHKLPFADAMLPHLHAVTRMEGITMQQAKETCNWPEGTKVNFQYGSGQDWVNNDRSDEEIEQHRKEWQHFVDHDMVPYGKVRTKFEGRGLVIVAGNQDTLMRVKVILRALIKLGSKIYVEINYWADEMNDAMKKELQILYPHMYFNDLSAAHNVIHIQKSGIYINYQLKTAAVINSRFAEPILLDSDNIPVIDPASLYDSDIYREYGTIFWPDIARTRPQNPAWAITNTPCRMDEYEQESGQLLVDKHRFFYHLQLAAWFNNNASDYYNQFLLGDKDTFRFAWHALQTQYGRPKKWLTSVGTVNEEFYCGHTFAQHHPDGRVAFMHGGLIKTVDMEVLEWNRKTQGGNYRYYKRSPSDEDPATSIDVGIKFDSGEYKPDHTDDFHGASCTDMYGVEPKSLDELVPDFEKTFEDIGGYWMLDETQKPVGGDGGTTSTADSAKDAGSQDKEESKQGDGSKENLAQR